MDKNHRMEFFSKAFIRAFAAPLGFNPEELEFDNDSIDIKLAAKDYNGLYRSPELHIQLKSTCDQIQNGKLKFKIKKKNYIDLQGTNLAFPRYLFIFSLPYTEKTWLVEKPTNIELYNNGYWYSLRNAPSIGNQKSKVIYIPSTNLITKDTLKKMMDLSSNGKSL
jgi:hypothetical protein